MNLGEISFKHFPFVVGLRFINAVGSFVVVIFYLLRDESEHGGSAS